MPGVQAALKAALLSALLAVVVSCGSTPSADVSGGATAPAEDPVRLVGSWLVEGADEEAGAVLRMDVGDVSLWRSCGYLDGSWRASWTGLFAADLFSGDPACMEEGKTPTPGWLGKAAGYRVDADGPMLVDADGAVVARLREGGRPTPGPNLLPSLADPPEVTAGAQRFFASPGPLSGGLVPATREDLIGRWQPVLQDDMRRPRQPSLHLREDGVYIAIDGCNGSSGRWVVGADGLVLATSGISTLIGCHNVDVGLWLTGAVRAGFDRGVLVLVNQEGAEAGRLRRA